MLKNGYTYGVVETRVPDPDADAERGGFGARWAHGSLGFGFHFQGFRKVQCLTIKGMDDRINKVSLGI